MYIGSYGMRRNAVLFIFDSGLFFLTIRPFGRNEISLRNMFFLNKSSLYNFYYKK